MNLWYLLDAFVYYLFAACPIKINDAGTTNPIRRCACSWLAKESVQDQSQIRANFLRFIAPFSANLSSFYYRTYATKIASMQRVQSARFVPTPSIAFNYKCGLWMCPVSRLPIKDASNKTLIKTKADSVEKRCVCVFIKNYRWNFLQFSI